MIRVKVQCTYEITLELHDDYARDDDELRFRLEENGCPGTGETGAALDHVMDEAESKSVCWACNLKGETKILEIVRS